MRKLTRYRFFAVSPPGLERIVLKELKELGLPEGHILPGGVEFPGGLDALYRANLWLRSASRVLVRVGSFRAKDFKTLVERIERYPWELYFHHTDRLKIRVSSHACRLYHTGALAERVLSGVEHRLGRHIRPDTRHADIDDPSQALLLLRGERDRFHLSVDSSGPHLYRRGYRKAHSKASIRENLAAGLLLMAGWTGNEGEALLDPFCGAGTIPIEAAMLSRRIAPGIHRGFAFQFWKNHDSCLWNRIRKEAMESGKRHSGFPIMGSDISRDAVEACLENAERAGVSECIQFEHRPVTRVPRMPPPGLLVTNPPYGKRVKGAGGGKVYKMLDGLLEGALRGWRWAVLCPEGRSGRLQKKSSRAAILSNGGIRVALWTGP